MRLSSVLLSLAFLSVGCAHVTKTPVQSVKFDDVVITGDLENPRALFEEAGKAAPTMVQAPYNLGRLYQRRVALYGDKVSGEVDRISQALFTARTLVPAYAQLSKDIEGTPRPTDGTLGYAGVDEP